MQLSPDSQDQSALQKNLTPKNGSKRRGGPKRTWEDILKDLGALGVTETRQSQKC